MMTKISILFAALIWWSVPSQAVVVHSVCPSGCDYPDPGAAEAALPSIVPTWPVLNDTYIFEWQAGQSFQTTVGLPYINNGQAYFACEETQGSAVLSCPQITDPVSSVTVAASMPVRGPGVPSGVTVSSVSGSGPYTVTLSSSPSPPSPLCTLSAGSETCTQTVTLYFGSAHWIVHRSNECYTFPTGTRAGAVHTTTGTGVYTGMAKLIAPAVTLAVAENSPGASYHRFECLEIASNTTPGNEPFYIVALYYQPAGSPGAIEHQISDLVHHIVFDRDYIHHYVENYANSRLYNSVAADSAYLEITNSTLMTFHTTVEGHAYSGVTTRGPIYLRNNEFETSQSGTLFGGGTPGIGGVKATGAQFLGNYYYRPWAWRVTSGTALPTNTFFPSTCMYDSNGGESYMDATNGHWYLCVSGTWTDQGVGTTPVPYYCNGGSPCTPTASTDLVCTSTASSATLTCNDTTGVQVGMIITGTPLAGATVSQVVNGTTLTTSIPALISETMSLNFTTTAAASNGITLYCTIGCSIDKTLWECKNCFGPVLDGNWLQNSWQPTLLGQGGQCSLLNQADNDNSGQYFVPDEVESYAKFTNNRCDSASTGFITGSVGGNYSHVDRGLQVKNNLFTNIGLAQITGPGLVGVTESSQMFSLGLYDNTAFDHNTMLLNSSVNKGSMGAGAWYCGYGSMANYFISWTNSITNSGNGVWESYCGTTTVQASASPGATVLNLTSQGYAWDILAGMTVSGTGIPAGTIVTNVSSNPGPGPCWATCSVTISNATTSALSPAYVTFGAPSPWNNLQFNPYALYYTAPTSNFSGDIIITNQFPCVPNGDSGNCGQYQFSSAPAVPSPPINLCNGCQFPTSMPSVFQSYPTNLAVSSTYQGTGYLGTDPGADIPVVTWSTQGAVSGAPNPYLDFRVRSLSVTSTTATYYYTAPDTGACTLNVANNSAYTSPAYSSSDSGGNPDRSVTVTGLSPNTRYWYKLVCGALNYRRSDVFITETP